MIGCDNKTLGQQDQAYDRAHRFGQTRDVHIYKLMIPDTVETRILQVGVRLDAFILHRFDVEWDWPLTLIASFPPSFFSPTRMRAMTFD